MITNSLVLPWLYQQCRITIVITLFLILVAIQLAMLLVVYVPQTKLRRTLAGVGLLGFSIASGLFVGGHFRYWSLITAVICLYQTINIARVVENRAHIAYLRHQVLASGLYLFAAFSISPLLAYVFSAINLLGGKYLIFGASSLAVSFALLVITEMNLRDMEPVKAAENYADDDLPTVSLLIPARNEDMALTESIHEALKSDYPKLEIIVLDDCSQDASSDIIRQFAQDGVRFIGGEMPKDGWLAKNQAYDALAQAASGDWLLMSGVDAKLSVSAIRLMVTEVLNQKLSMISLLPRRTNDAAPSSLLFPLRYFWQVAMPKRQMHQSSVLSTCWMIKKSALKKLGGFKSVSHSVSPESHFANALETKYQFLRSSNGLTVTTDKSLAEQYSTAIRVLYPSLHKRIERVMVGSLLIFMFGLAPFILLTLAIFRTNITGELLYGLSCVFLILVQARIGFATARRNWLLAAIVLPYSFLQEIGLLNLSMYKYEFSEVLWKGRNICYPIMHIVPRLPNQ